MRTCWVILAVMLACRLGAAEKSAPVVEDFKAEGVIVDVYKYFKVAQALGAAQPAQEGVAGRALVTNDGVYAFLETPENVAALKQAEPSSAVRVEGKVLRAGQLLVLSKLEKIEKANAALEKFAANAGEDLTLKGVNKCQCVLNVGELPHNCKLGHLHHLESADGNIYHYLQFGKAADAFLGKGSHCRPLTVKGKVLPGHFLLVESVELSK